MYSNLMLETIRGCVSLQKYKSQGKDVEVTVISNEENSKDFCLDFVQESSLWWPEGPELRHYVRVAANAHIPALVGREGGGGG